MSQQFQRLKAKLEELFQLDRPDLDFGVYRIMHARSAEISSFLEKDLLPQVREAFAQYRSADREGIQKELQQAIEHANSLDVDPETTPKVKALRARLTDAVDVAGLEVEVYDHLYNFFRRYYSDGDFLSHRVYRAGVYAIPYEGEEVKLHWANADQYYIKTDEYLRDYTFLLRPDDPADKMRVHFKLVDAAEGEHGTVKEIEGKNRVFVLAPGDFVTEDSAGGISELVVRFEYRPATSSDWPADQVSTATKPPTQKDLNPINEGRILSALTGPMIRWSDALGPRLSGHLAKYAARNTFDYFIHKDLGGFLRRELDFYIKNEVMHLDDVESELVPRVEQYLSKIKVIRRIAGKIITFLAQLEDFQKRLWLKKKFVTETFWCIRLGCIPEEFYPEIAKAADQVAEWRRLYAIDEIKGTLTTAEFSEPPSVEFLRSQPALVVDTRRVDDDLADRILTTFNELGSQSDGTLINADNYQALRAVEPGYGGRVEVVYIDPPYNTAASEIAYKNSYKHSSWLSLVADRIATARTLMAKSGVLCVAIDDAEYSRLQLLLDDIYDSSNYLATAVIRVKPQGRAMATGFSQNHEYALFYGRSASAEVGRLPRDEDRLARYAGRDEQGIFAWANLRATGANSYQPDRPKLYYPIWVRTSDGTVTVPELCWDESSGSWAKTEGVLPAGYVEAFPIDDDGGKRVWTLGNDRARIEAADTLSAKLADGRWQVYRKYRPNQEGALPGTWWADAKYSASESGTKILHDILGESGVFSYPKSIFTVEDCLRSAGLPRNGLVVDFFGGSGTTAHAAINLNRSDGGRRRFLLVEQGDYFDTVLLPRVKKVSFSPDWKDGRPVRTATQQEVDLAPRIVKVTRLESYEDTLNNLDLRRSDGQQSLLEAPEAAGADGLREQYLLKYMLDVEARGSQSLLNVTGFLDPRAYRLKVKRPGSDETRDVNVDLLETFNYLVGLTVDHMAAPQTFSARFTRDDDPDLPTDAPRRLLLDGWLKPDPSGPWWFRTVTGRTADGLVLVVWRNRPGGESPDGIERDNLVLDEWFKKSDFSSKDSEFKVIWVNGDNNLENLKVTDDNETARWKVRLIEEDFHRLMFEMDDD